MEELNYSAKIAVIKILDELQNADKIIHPKEMAYMNEIVERFSLSNNYKQEVDNLLTLQALSVISKLSPKQKEQVAQMMGKMIICDGNIDYNEVKLYNAFCDSCDINRDFNLDEYPEMTLSGPFQNPEDLMNGI